MTVEELLIECQKLVDVGMGACEVIKSKDDEGNGFQFIDELATAYMHPYDDTETIHPDDMEEWIEECEADGEEPPDFQEVICIW